MDPEALRSFQRLGKLIPEDLKRAFAKSQEFAPIREKIARLSAGLYDTQRPAETPKPEWSVATDPAIPEKFKEIYRTELAADHRSKKRRQFWQSIDSDSREIFSTTFAQPYSEQADFYTIEFNAIAQYLELARQHYEDPKLEPVTQPLLWERVCLVHRNYCRWRYGKNGPDTKPSHRQRLFKKFGLDNLPGTFPSGRPPSEY